MKVSRITVFNTILNEDQLQAISLANYQTPHPNTG